MPPIIEVRDLRKSYGGVERLHGISFEVEPGQIFGFLGVNGAGKTTTIEILEGYRARDSGQVAVLGKDPARSDRAWRNRIGLVLQETTMNPVYKVRETVTMFARYFSSSSSVDKVLEAAGLRDQADERIGRLSGGQKRRVDVALGLVGDPELLFLDEPTTGLDPSARRDMWTMIEGLRDAGKTVFLTTHYMDEAQHLSDHIVILRAGTIVAEGSPDQLSRSLGSTAEISFELPKGLSPERLKAMTASLATTLKLEARTVRFNSQAVQRDLTLLLAWAQREHVELARLWVKPPTLDDVFIRLATSDQIAPRGGASAQDHE